ncbi:hypothetical protein Nepgr_014334 [Nepenthes gracilis]|uniref:RING-type E3 ubiquitin transferase n=1 Tax=Nepenthes gracilis TaxID=150966 RepID=A0AAD3XPR8_NEPGR|nr:hypothetical protein Nepgr_014334 [Nepenthes gracilis]
MSTTGGNAAGDQAYFCYQCNRTVTLTPSPNSDILCPDCNGGFLEEVETHDPNPNSSPFSTPMVDAFSEPLYPAGFGGGGARGPIVFSSTTIDIENPQSFSNILLPPVHQETHVFNPFEFLQNHLQNLRASGASIQFVIENHPSDSGFRIPANIGDYYFGSGLEQLIQQLAENDPNRHGTPPASKKAVEGLPNIKITEDLVKSDSIQCAVCMNEFELGLEVKQMPCKHIFHRDCIMPWLELHNSCPICRYELPTDDPDYDRRVRENRGSGSSTGGVGGSAADSDGSQGSSHTPRIVERRFRISLPWPFSALASSGGSSDGGASRNNSSGDQGSGSGDHQIRDHELEPRE